MNLFKVQCCIICDQVCLLVMRLNRAQRNVDHKWLPRVHFTQFTPSIWKFTMCLTNKEATFLNLIKSVNIFSINWKKYPKLYKLTKYSKRTLPSVWLLTILFCVQRWNKLQLRWRDSGNWVAMDYALKWFAAIRTELWKKLNASFLPKLLFLKNYLGRVYRKTCKFSSA